MESEPKCVVRASTQSGNFAASAVSHHEHDRTNRSALRIGPNPRADAILEDEIGYRLAPGYTASGAVQAHNRRSRALALVHDRKVGEFFQGLRVPFANFAGVVDAALWIVGDLYYGGVGRCQGQWCQCERCDYLFECRRRSILD